MLWSIDAIHEECVSQDCRQFQFPIIFFNMINWNESKKKVYTDHLRDKGHVKKFDHLFPLAFAH